jgi:hypothetical protein
MVHSKPWAKWSPDPLASDSAFATLSATSMDSLSASELSWLAVQRDWRAQRDEESRVSASITRSWHPHHARLADARFAELASRPYAALADSERAWLVAESAAQRGDLTSRPVNESSSSSVVGLVLLSALAGALLAIWLIAYSIGHTYTLY